MGQNAAPRIAVAFFSDALGLDHNGMVFYEQSRHGERSMFNRAAKLLAVADNMFRTSSYPS